MLYFKVELTETRKDDTGCSILNETLTSALITVLPFKWYTSIIFCFYAVPHYMLLVTVGRFDEGSSFCSQDFRVKYHQKYVRGTAVS
jgi:hypothetical protein